VTTALVHDLAGFARHHRDVAVEVVLTAPPAGGSRDAMRALATLAESGVPVTWDPAGFRRLAPPAVPALWLRDAQGRGVRASGRPSLDALWQAAREAAP
jgi:hypothetical protein